MASPAARFDMVPFEIRIAGLKSTDLRVLSFSGQERVSEPFDYTIDLVSADDGLALEELVGKACELQINTVDGEPERWLHGVIASFQQAESNGRLTAYRTRVVPPLQLLSYRHDCRVFQDMSAPEIIANVFDLAGMRSYKMRLEGNYTSRTYCVQYRESDLNFVTRLMQEEGIFYFFEHTRESSILALVDQSTAHPPLPIQDTLEYHNGGGGLAPGDFVFGISWRESITTNAVVLRDFDFRKPSVEHMHVDDEAEQSLRFEHYDYPGLYQEAITGDSRVRSRLDALQTGRQLVSASTTVRRMLPGHRFELTAHPNNRFNREFIVSSVHHTGRSPQALEQDQGSESPDYTCEFSAVPSDTVLRSELTAHQPRIEGVQTAIVVGPVGEEIYTDAFGRVKVQFHWDRVGAYNENSSCWLRVSQTSAGAGWGALDIPRVGHEVLVSFVDGDPSRPIITGRVYNGINRPPNGLPEKKVQMSMKSNSSPGGGGSNELTFSDTKGDEGVYFHAQYNLNQETGYNKSESVGNDTTTTVGNNQSLSVAANRNLDIGGDNSESVAGNVSTQIGASKMIKAGSDVLIDAGSSLTLKCGASTLSMTAGGIVTISGTIVNVTGMVMSNIAAPITTVTGAAMLNTTGAFHNIGGSKVSVSGGDVSVKSGGAVDIKGSEINLN